ncbi:hypothetical protein ACIBF6_36255 [Streptosporangium amethystogenes]|uniref:hypothetical protein n=1 Tax=Streptosporangium amethystogenes TaxID=2002 RepID=UPI0037A8FC60
MRIEFLAEVPDLNNDAVSDLMPAVRLIGPLRREYDPAITVGDLLTPRTPEAIARHLDDNS